MAKIKLRSAEWFDRPDEMGLRHRSVLGTQGYDLNRIAGRPIIGICNPVSEFNNCEIGFRELIPAIKRGVLEAGGIPLEFPTMALGLNCSSRPICFTETWFRWISRRQFAAILLTASSCCATVIRQPRRS